MATLSFCVIITISQCPANPRGTRSVPSATRPHKMRQHLFVPTFNICNKVVFPALSRPRNRSLACLFRSPKEARVSQTIGRELSVCCSKTGAQRGMAGWLLTPVDDPHLGISMKGGSSISGYARNVADVLMQLAVGRKNGWVSWYRRVNLALAESSH